MSVDLSHLLDIDVTQIPDAEVVPLLQAVDEAIRAQKFGIFHGFFPDLAKCTHADDRGFRYNPGPIETLRFYARDYYTKHLEFFRAGKDYTERLLLAANRVGKTECGAYEMTSHLTGLYKPWWEGRVWNRPVKAWAAGDFNETTRDVIQKKLLGEVEWHGDKKGVDGTGMIPRDQINMDSITWKSGVPDLIDTVKIDHRNLSGTPDGTSTLGLKSYQQGRRSFQGTEQDIIWPDEEPPLEVYNEMMIRLMTTKGMAMLTFTPLMGWTEVVDSFYPERHA
jgi:phage terminase large subunit-like protein